MSDGLIAVRDRVKDSLLSYAGARDPGTGIVWGGVVSNSVQLLLNHNASGHGLYASLGASYLHGEFVEDNWSADGSAGTYWNVNTGGQSNLTLGLNVAGMAYRKNSNFFTLGQGGYFSPQQYILANVPVQWRGTYNQKVQYMVNASLGAQHFQEAASPFFPTLPALQGRNGPHYPKQVSTGANYSVDIQSSVPLTPVWHLGIFANMNNTRNFHSAAAGVFLRFSTRPRPLNQEVNIPSIPDWRGVEPFRLF